MVLGSGYVEQELGLDNNSNSNVVGSVVDGSVVDSAATTVEQAAKSMNVQGVTFFFLLRAALLLVTLST